MMKARKVLIIVDNLGGGGAQRQIYLLTKNLQHPNIEFIILTYHQYTEDVYGKKLKKLGIKVTELDLSNYLQRFVQVRSYVKSEKPDVILSFLGGANILSCLVKLSLMKKLDLYVSDRRGLTGALSKRDWFKYHLYRLAANRVVANSIDIKQNIEEKAPWLKGKTLLIWNMIEPPIVSEFPTDKRRETILKIVVGASYQRLKNVRNFIIGVGEIVQKEQFDSSDIQVEWYGNKMEATNMEYLNELQNLINKYGLEKIFKLNGFTESIQDKLNLADFAALPSFFEGCPNFIIEAMYLQKPVIISDVCSNAYILNYEGGFFFSPSSTEQISAAIKKAYCASSEERKEMGIKNRQRANQLFSINEKLTQYRELLLK